MPATGPERHELLRLYLPIIGKLKPHERLLVVQTLRNGNSEQVGMMAAWCREKIDEINEMYAEREA